MSLLFFDSVGYFVNDQVKVLIMEPLLDLLMSTPPESNISRVSELMLLTIFARHDSHRIGKYISRSFYVVFKTRGVFCRV